ncbi:MAG: YlxR family protein [Acidimicrobiales bacterium]
MTPNRTCIGCRRVRQQSDLVRFTAGTDGQATQGRNQSGRGAWLCRSVDCLERAVAKSAFERALGVPLGAEDMHLLQKEFDTSQVHCGS